MARRFDVPLPIRHAYGPVCEESECGMVIEAGLDNTGHDREEWDAAAPGASDFSDGSPNPRYARDMPDPRKLAQDWITLWQSELTAMAADPEMRETWQTVMALWAGSMASLLRGVPRAERHDRAGRHPRSADPPRAAAAAAAPDPRDAEIERLARHVAALERRLAELERGGDPPVRPTVDPKKRGAGRKQRR